MIQVPPAPPSPPHHHFPGGPPGMQALPAEFDRLNLGLGMGPQVNGPHRSHNPMLESRPANFSHDFDTSLLRKEKAHYEGYNFEKLEPEHANQKPSWALVSKTQMPLTQEDLLAQVNKQKKKGSPVRDLYTSSNMEGFKKKQVDHLIEERNRADPRFKHELVGLKLDQKRIGRNVSTHTFQVILKRQVRSDLTGGAMPGLGKLHEPSTQIVDLTGASDDPSEGSSQDYFGHPSPPPHFPSQPFHEPRRFEHQQPGPFAHHPGLEVHHGSPPIHDGPPPNPHGQMPMHPPHPMPEPFLHHEHQENAPRLPALHSMPEPMHNGPLKMPTQNGAMPKVHQEKSHQPHQKQKKAYSDTDTDSASDSGFSRTDTERTPDTDHSSRSSHRGKKYHDGYGHSRRSSRSHNDDREHEEAYRIHRRKLAQPRDRSPHREHRQYEFETVEVVPARRPQLSRSLTTNYYRDCPHTDQYRTMSYEEERAPIPRGLNPTRRRSVYMPKRITDLDLHDEREEMRREIMKDEIEKEREREEIAWEVRRELAAAAKAHERESNIMRRRDRGINGERFYEERPGRYSRGYDNDLHLW